jgi:hypothetical protein
MTSEVKDIVPSTEDASDEESDREVITLKSDDGTEYTVDIDYAIVSSMLKNACEGDINEPIIIPRCSSNTLRIIVAYMNFREGDVSGIASPLKHPLLTLPAVHLIEDLDPVELKNVLHVADQMGIDSLLQLGCAFLAKKIIGYPLQHIAKVINGVDFKSEETGKSIVPEDGQIHNDNNAYYARLIIEKESHVSEHIANMIVDFIPTCGRCKILLIYERGITINRPASCGQCKFACNFFPTYVPEWVCESPRCKLVHYQHNHRTDPDGYMEQYALTPSQLPSRQLIYFFDGSGYKNPINIELCYSGGREISNTYLKIEFGAFNTSRYHDTYEYMLTVQLRAYKKSTTLTIPIVYDPDSDNIMPRLHTVIRNIIQDTYKFETITHSTLLYINKECQTLVKLLN